MRYRVVCPDDDATISGLRGSFGNVKTRARIREIVIREAKEVAQGQIDTTTATSER